MNQRVIDLLNQGREAELGAIMQYMTHHYELEDAMYGKLGSRLRKIAIVEMKHAEMLAERILFLGGIPSTKPALDPQSGIRKGQSIPELLQTDIGLEDGAIKMYNDAAKACADEGDHVSKHLFEDLAEQEERHLDEFQNTADFVEKLGAAYLATLTGGSGD